MQEFEFADNGVFEKDGVEYRNKGQVEIEDKLFYLFVTSDVPNFAPLYLKATKKFVVLVVTDDKAREATEEERVILQCKCRRCINCGEVITKEDWIWVDGDTLCAERHYFQCSNCGTWTRNPLQMTDGDYICNECFETGDYYICDDCGNVIDPDTDGIIIRSDSVYCEDCASEHADPNEEYIHEYGYSPCIMFNEGNELNSCPKKGERYFGLEIETECTGDKDRILAYIEFVDALLEYCSESNYLQIYKSDFLDLNKYAEGWGKYENLTHRFSVLNQEL